MMCVIKLFITVTTPQTYPSMQNPQDHQENTTEKGGGKGFSTQTLGTAFIDIVFAKRQGI